MNKITLAQQIEEVLNANEKALLVQANVQYPMFNTNFDVEISIENIGKATIKAFVNEEFKFFIEDGHQCAQSENSALAEAISDAINDETMLFEAIFDKLNSDEIQEKFTKLVDELKWEADGFDLDENYQEVVLTCVENPACYYNVQVQLPDTPDSMAWIDGEQAGSDFDYALVSLASKKLYAHYGNGDKLKAKLSFITAKEVVSYEERELTFEYYDSYFDNQLCEPVSTHETVDKNVIYAYHDNDKEDYTIIVETSNYYNDEWYETLEDFLNKNLGFSIKSGSEDD